MTSAQAALRRPIRVMIVDDNRQVRSSVAAILEAAGDIVVCGEADGVGQAEAVAAVAEPDVAIVDLRLGAESGIRAGREVRARRPQTHVILLTSASDEEARVASALAGADGYLVKQLRQTDIVGAVRAVSGGGDHRDALSPTDMEHLRSRMAGADEAQNELFDLVIDGLTDGEISSALHLEQAEVRAQVDALVGRLRPESTYASRPSRF
ncbi:MAG TPA: response regulator transcription factor [Acidimicrobiales bacterium]|nr:response regulator transcription factor [Acidimicrobiales bacterium]